MRQLLRNLLSISLCMLRRCHIIVTIQAYSFKKIKAFRLASVVTLFSRLFTWELSRNSKCVNRSQIMGFTKHQIEQYCVCKRFVARKRFSKPSGIDFIERFRSFAGKPKITLLLIPQRYLKALNVFGIFWLTLHINCFTILWEGPCTFFKHRPSFCNF